LGGHCKPVSDSAVIINKLNQNIFFGNFVSFMTVYLISRDANP
jgi:hypothetical protein